MPRVATHVPKCTAKSTRGFTRSLGQLFPGSTPGCRICGGGPAMGAVVKSMILLHEAVGLILLLKVDILSGNFLCCFNTELKTVFCMFIV